MPLQCTDFPKYCILSEEEVEQGGGGREGEGHGFLPKGGDWSFTCNLS